MRCLRCGQLVGGSRPTCFECYNEVADEQDVARGNYHQPTMAELVKIAKERKANEPKLTWAEREEAERKYRAERLKREGKPKLVDGMWVYPNTKF